MAKGKVPEKWTGDGLRPARQSPPSSNDTYAQGFRGATTLVLGLLYVIVCLVLFGLLAFEKLEADVFVSTFKTVSLMFGLLALLADGSARNVVRRRARRLRRRLKSLTNPKDARKQKDS